MNDDVKIKPGITIIYDGTVILEYEGAYDLNVKNGIREKPDLNGFIKREYDGIRTITITPKD